MKISYVEQSSRQIYTYILLENIYSNTKLVVFKIRYKILIENAEIRMLK